jgi:hypothetical protein
MGCTYCGEIDESVEESLGKNARRSIGTSRGLSLKQSTVQFPRFEEVRAQPSQPAVQ